MTTKLLAFPTTLAFKLAKLVEESRWLIECLWAAEGVGVVGGEPKSYKSFIALAMGVAVASGQPCFGKYRVPETGPVLVFCGEDQLHDVRARVEAIALASGTSFATLNMHVITVASLRIDVGKDRERLDATIKAIRPKLLILDPFVRLHNVDENKSGEVAPLLGYLRELQRTYHTAVLLVHHAKKGGKKERGGQALRGSSEFHAWGDSNLYPRRRNRDSETIILEVEHRNAPAIHGLVLQPERFGESIALMLREGLVFDDDEGEDGDNELEVAAPNNRELILTALTKAGKPMSRNDLRKTCRVRTTTIITVLTEMLKAKEIRKQGRGYVVGSSKKKLR